MRSPDGDDAHRRASSSAVCVGDTTTRGSDSRCCSASRKGGLKAWFRARKAQLKSALSSTGSVKYTFQRKRQGPKARRRLLRKTSSRFDAPPDTAIEDGPIVGKAHVSTAGLRRRKNLARPRSLSALFHFCVVLLIAAAFLGRGCMVLSGAPGSNAGEPTAHGYANATHGASAEVAACHFPYFQRYSGACVSRGRVNGQTFYYHVPRFTTGYVVLIHGAGVGRAEDWFVRINRIPIMKQLISYGFAVSSVQSVAQWTMMSRRQDLTNQDQAFWQLVAARGMDPSVPVFAVCVSRGCQYQGWMAEMLFLQGRPLAAQYFSMPWGVTPGFFLRSPPRMPPTIAAIGGTDGVPLVNTRRDLEPWVAAMRMRGIEARLFVNDEGAVDACFHTLCRMPEAGGLGVSRELVRELTHAGVLDAAGSIVVDLPMMQGTENPSERMVAEACARVDVIRDWPATSHQGPAVDWVFQELSEVQGGHRHTSDFDHAVLDLFVKHTVYGEILREAREEERWW